MEEQYFQRILDAKLQQWSIDVRRKPLLLRGARQVGKTSAVRNLGTMFEYYVELDMNDMPNLHPLFEKQLSPQQICEQISLIVNTPIIAGKTLLFLDEIQSCPAAIGKLRYFYEQYPELHLIAAGSLLEFALEDLPSFGVGRIRSIFMYPFSFEEFLMALGENNLVEAYRNASPQNPLFEAVHQKLTDRLRTFMIIGGMPEVVAVYAKKRDLIYCQGVLNDIMISFKDDFTKYRRKIPSSRINDVFISVAEQGLGKFVYSRVNTEARAEQIKQALDALIMAGLVYPVTHTSANGIPLGAEINEKYQRMILFDTGLLLRVLGLYVSDILLSNDIKIINRGAVAETFVGTELIKTSYCYSPERLYYWHQEKNNSNAEVDFVVQVSESIYPLEVKSGVKGSMQSMRIFLEKKNIKTGIRTSLENFCHYNDIEVYPLYAISNLYKHL